MSTKPVIAADPEEWPRVFKVKIVHPTRKNIGLNSLRLSDIPHPVRRAGEFFVSVSRPFGAICVRVTCWPYAVLILPHRE
jgi:hypothetical protein